MKNFDSFGVMIDCSRNAVPNLDSLKHFFSVIAKMGYNCAMLYTEDTYEVQNQPFFGYKRGRYSVEELRELDEFAESVGIELIPCIQTLAHMNAALRWDAYRPFVDCDDILLIGDDRTYALIEDMFATLSSCIRSRRIHIGMDEAYRVGLGKYLREHGYQNRYDILLPHLQKVCDIAKKYGYEALMWEDMFFRFASGNYFPEDDNAAPIVFPDDVRARIPDNLSMVYWDYYGEDEKRYDMMLESSKNLSDKVWFAGGTWCWGGFTPHNRLSIRRNTISIPACRKHGVSNVLLTMWGDNGGECTVWNMLPALMHAAAMAEELSEDEMKARFLDITGEHYDDMLALDLPNYVYGEDTDVWQSNFSKNRLFNDPLLRILDRNVKETVDPARFAAYAERLRGLEKKSDNYDYLYATQAALAEALAIKFDLGIRTHDLYRAGDKKALRRLAKKDYTEFLRRLEAFYETFRYQWYTDNKTYGFEVQDARLGGLIWRTKSCRDRILEYCDGYVDAIPELDEEVLENDGGNVGEWCKMITACPI